MRIVVTRMNVGMVPELIECGCKGNRTKEAYRHCIDHAPDYNNKYTVHFEQLQWIITIRISIRDYNCV
jgi:hypothetical protein